MYETVKFSRNGFYFTVLFYLPVLNKISVTLKRQISIFIFTQTQKNTIV